MNKLVNGNNTFAFELYQHLRTQPGNLFFSPYSISSALAMTYAGARGNTAEQMAKVLHFMPDQHALHPAFQDLTNYFREIQAKGDLALQVANALWLQQHFDVLDEFLDIIETYYDAGVFPVNFQEAYEEARVRINAWVAEQTKDKIQDLIPRGVLNELTRLVLTNAIYFKGTWVHTFDEKQTTNMPFWTTPVNKSPVPMMHQKIPFKYSEDGDVQILELPYAGQDLSMLLLLPKAKDGLADLEHRLNSRQLDAWMTTLTLREVDVYMPKFQSTSQFSLSTTLQEMGMTDAFSQHADFSGIEPSKMLAITDVIHKAFVEVNEEGTEAAAATAVVVGVTSVALPTPVPVFRADHPFVFLIQEQETGSILFLGRLVNPGK